MPFAATWMDLKIINLSESEKDKYHVSLTYGILKYDIKELIYKTRKRFIDTENKFMVTKGKGEWKRQIRNLEIICIHYYIHKQINNKDLVYAQYSVIYIYVCV